MLHYGYIDPRLNRYILGCDEVRFFNHSDTPNVVPDFTRDRHGVDIAARDIAAGEELTVNYEWVDGERPEPAYLHRLTGDVVEDRACCERAVGGPVHRSRS